MHDDLRHLDLTFPSIPVGNKETPPNLKRLLYKGGVNRHEFSRHSQAAGNTAFHIRPATSHC